MVMVDFLQFLHICSLERSSNELQMIQESDIGILLVRLDEDC